MATQDDQHDDDRVGDTKARSKLHEVVGRIKRSLGWVTGDRRYEAEGVAQQRQGRSPTEDAVSEAHHDVKRSYGETLDARRHAPERDNRPID